MNTHQPEPLPVSVASRCIQPLLDVTEATTHGEKACRLGDMARLGHPVPDGVVIAGNFFIETLREHGTQDFINTRVRGLVLENLTEVSDASRDIEARIMDITFPAVITRRSLIVFKKLA